MQEWPKLCQAFRSQLDVRLVRSQKSDVQVIPRDSAMTSAEVQHLPHSAPPSYSYYCEPLLQEGSTRCWRENTFSVKLLNLNLNVLDEQQALLCLLKRFESWIDGCTTQPTFGKEDKDEGKSTLLFSLLPSILHLTHWTETTQTNRRDISCQLHWCFCGHKTRCVSWDGRIYI